MKDRLIALGLDGNRIMVRSGELDPNPTRILATGDSWNDADFLVGLLDAGKQQVDRLAQIDGSRVDLELVLGADARHTAGWTDGLIAAGLPEPTTVPLNADE